MPFRMNSYKSSAHRSSVKVSLITLLAPPWPTILGVSELINRYLRAAKRRGSTMATGASRFTSTEYRQALLRMRQGATDQEIVRSKLMGRKKARQVREIVAGRVWLDPAVAPAHRRRAGRGFARQPATNSVSPLAQTRTRSRAGWTRTSSRR